MVSTTEFVDTLSQQKQLLQDEVDTKTALINLIDQMITTCSGGPASRTVSAAVMSSVPPPAPVTKFGVGIQLAVLAAVEMYRRYGEEGAWTNTEAAAAVGMTHYHWLTRELEPPVPETFSSKRALSKKVIEDSVRRNLKSLGEPDTGSLIAPHYRTGEKRVQGGKKAYYRKFTPNFKGNLEKFFPHIYERYFGSD